MRFILNYLKGLRKLESIENFKRIINLKKDLILKSESVLIDEFLGKDKIDAFLKDVSLLLEKENAFLLLSSKFIDNILNIIQANSHYIKDKDLIDLKNKIIVKLNLIQNNSDNMKQYLAYNYINYQDDVRHLCFENIEHFLGAMAYDAEIFDELVEDRINDFPFDDLFLATTNYFLEVIPELYSDEQIRNITLKHFEKIKEKKSFKDRMLKKYLKLTKKIFDCSVGEYNG